ncbi:MAG: alpha-glucan family phosphorylase [Phycisphaerales bacterium]|nr:alpha-glucan family phosphorylase [Phycisphaerales bacterium]
MNTRTFVVQPRLPEPLEPLRTLAYNLWWSWNPPATDLFRRLDVDLWETCGHNPVVMLGQISQERLERMARDDAFVAQLTRVMDAFYIYHEGRTWFGERFPQFKNQLVAYFSAEFGIHESLPIYSGGLGVLAGDHLKSASDLGVPLIGVGLMYRNGYFEQQLTQDGSQLDIYNAYDFHRWPATQALTPEGAPVRVTVHMGEQAVIAQVWTARVGRVRLFLLDADLPDNPPEYRSVTHRLYGGDSTMRIRQEILLGVGGMRVLRAVGVAPDVCHMNEGHAAFLALERIRLAMVEKNLTYHQAREATCGGNLFTTHTPVPAGIDRFDPKLVESHLEWMARDLGISMNELLSIGRENPADLTEEFCMAILALRLAYRSNGVSRLHGEVSRGMWKSCWPNVPRDEIPITHVTNGIHLRSWTSATMGELFEQYLGPTWAEDTGDPELWQRISSIPDAEIWRVHERRRERLITFARRRLRDELTRRGAPPAEIEAAESILDPKALTIGFARRFAPYKRATLILRNIERLATLVNNSNRPVQIIFAGKAHPRDGAGKELIKQLMATIRKPELRRRIVLLENYDINLARELVQGVDVWLNNPIRPLEASGTSGMKVIANGGLNASCLDGWWIEAYNGENGWAIGDGRVYEDNAYRDQVESDAMYNLFESEILPLFYDRGDDGLPRRWLARVKQSMRTIAPFFNTHRMLREYSEQLYTPAMTRYRHLSADTFRAARDLSAWKDDLRQRWNQIQIVDVSADAPGVLKVGDSLSLRARVKLGAIDPKDVNVEIYVGPISPTGEIVHGKRVMMRRAGDADGAQLYEGSIICASSGQHGYSVEVVPNHADLAEPHDNDLVVWG